MIKMISTEEQENKTNYSEQQLKGELMNVDFSGIEVPKAKIHPQWQALLQFVQMKADELQCPEFKLSEDLSGFSLHVFQSLSFDFLSCILIFNIAAFIFDDYIDICNGDIEEVILRIKTQKVHGNALYEKWWGLCVKVCKQVMSEKALGQLSDLLLKSLSSSSEMIQLLTDRVTLSDNEFTKLRCIDSGGPHQSFLVFVGTGNELTDELQNDPNYLGFNKQTVLHATLINDLYSLRKEVLDNTYRNNYVYVKMTNGNITAQMAANEIIREIKEADELARMYGGRLKEKNDPNLSRYVDGMYDLLAGNHYWSSTCKRYNQITHMKSNETSCLQRTK